MCNGYPGRETRNNSWLQFNRLFNNRGTASPTRPQSVGGNCTPESAVKPRGEHTSHLQFMQSHIIKLLSQGPTALEPEHQSPRY